MNASMSFSASSMRVSSLTLAAAMAE